MKLRPPSELGRRTEPVVVHDDAADERADEQKPIVPNRQQ
jgi:hypothetical protein